MIEETDNFGATFTADFTASGNHKKGRYAIFIDDSEGRRENLETLDPTEIKFVL